MKQGGEQGQKETELKKNTKLTGGHIGILSSCLKKKTSSGASVTLLLMKNIYVCVH